MGDSLGETAHDGDATPSATIEEISACRHQMRLHGHRDKQIWNVHHLSPAETGRCHPDNGEGATVHNDLLADHTRIAPEQATPEALGEDSLRMRPRTLVDLGREVPADVGGHAHHVEVGRGHHGYAEGLRSTVR